MEKSKNKRLTLNGQKHRSSVSPKTPLSCKQSSSINESPSTPKSNKFNNLINNTTEYDYSPSNDDYITASQSAMSNYRDVIWQWNDDGIATSKSPINQSTPPFLNRKQRDFITPTLLQQIEPKIDKTKGFYKFQKLLLGEGAKFKNLINSINTETQQQTTSSFENLNNQASVKNSENGVTRLDTIEDSTNNITNLDSIILSDEDDLNSAVANLDETDLDKFNSLSEFQQNLPNKKEVKNDSIELKSLKNVHNTKKEKYDDEILNLLDDSECELLAECTQVVEKSLKTVLKPTKEIVSSKSDIFENVLNISKNKYTKENFSTPRNENKIYNESLLNFSNCNFDSPFEIKTTELQLEKSTETQYSTNQKTYHSNLSQQKSQFSRHKSMPSPTVLVTNNKSIATNKKNFSRLHSSDSIPLEINKISSTVKHQSNSSTSVTSLELSETEGRRRIFKEELERKKIEAQQRLRRKQLARQQKEAWAQRFSQKKN